MAPTIAPLTAPPAAPRAAPPITCPRPEGAGAEGGGDATEEEAGARHWGAGLCLGPRQHGQHGVAEVDQE